MGRKGKEGEGRVGKENGGKGRHREGYDEWRENCRGSVERGGEGDKEGGKIGVGRVG